MLCCVTHISIFLIFTKLPRQKNFSGVCLDRFSAACYNHNADGLHNLLFCLPRRQTKRNTPPRFCQGRRRRPRKTFLSISHFCLSQNQKTCPRGRRLRRPCGAKKSYKYITFKKCISFRRLPRIGGKKYVILSDNFS